jgi:competence ComEA-like helix-hairpin-helix protein
MFGLALTLGLTLISCARRPNHQAAARADSAVSFQTSPERINLNTDSANELETLPGIGKGLAARIIEHREKYGPFRRAEHLIIVRGISDRRFRALRDLITVE